MATCREKAIDLIARRPHFRGELEQKLLSRGFPVDDVQSVLAELAGRGWLDDRSNARDLARGAWSRRGFGPRRMLAELRRRGVDQEVADEVVGEIFSEPGEELERARRVVDARARGREESPDRLARMLDRRGFSKSVILELLHESEDV